MKKGWPVKKLSEIYRIGSSKRVLKSEWKTEGVPFYRGREVTRLAADGFVENELFISEKHFAELSKEYGVPKAGDIVITAIGTIGNSHVVRSSDRFYFKDASVLWMKRTAEVNSEFINLWLKSPAFFDQLDRGNGATVDTLTIQKLQSVEVALPPLAEQQRIVGLLDEAFEGIATAKANAEKNLQNARALFESHLQSVFTQRGPGWVEKPLGDLCDFLNGFAFKSGDVVSESQTQLVRMGNLYGNQLDLDRSPVFYPDRFATAHSRYVLKEGDIIMSLTGTTGKEDYGFAVRIPDCGHTLLMNQRIMKFDALRRDMIDDGYLLHYLRSRCFLDILYPTANGTRQANLSSVTMKLLPVPLRSLKEQKAIAMNLDALSEETQLLARLYERKLAALEALKKSLLHQAFTGGFDKLSHRYLPA